MFSVYINNKNENTGEVSYLNVFADDFKIQRMIATRDVCKNLQEDVNEIYKRSDKWYMEFNAKIFT